ncbi:RCAR3 INTERACTING F-BOX PROTEIN 1 [Hibiscus trionum]|uniref:RCAR3 INTERACTING F-BOX PROTEIN 1 n=1 Tax=Hibiscus trionum TaxID=183268 RepID=A0A9W7IW51_HIBTR|nr:RCAR3 INTERACTING F-BOX PROTEIN 1 [Hibiscus trionum]
MAVNFSHQPVFPANLTEDGCMKSCHSDREMESCFDYGRDMDGHRCGSRESVLNDIIDLLPSDPFGMDLTSTFSAITGWLGALEFDYGCYVRDEVGTGDGSYKLFAGLNMICNNAMWFQTFPGSMGFKYKGCVSGQFGGCSKVQEGGDVSGCAACGSDCNVVDILHSGNEDMISVDLEKEEIRDCEACSQGPGEAPHEALILVLGYLDVRDLLVVKNVCTSLRNIVQNDLLLWRSIHIDQSLNEKLTDDALLQITKRAQGSLQCLSLVDCKRISDDGLMRVVENNQKLIKLSVPGCTRLSIEGILNSLKALKSMGTQGVKHLRVGGLFGATVNHFEELKFLLGMDNQIQKIVHKPHFYNRRNLYLSSEDDRVIDIEMCPRCQNMMLLYDCPAEGCQRKNHIA